MFLIIFLKYIKFKVYRILGKIEYRIDLGEYE